MVLLTEYEGKDVLIFFKGRESAVHARIHSIDANFVQWTPKNEQGVLAKIEAKDKKWYPKLHLTPVSEICDEGVVSAKGAEL